MLIRWNCFLWFCCFSIGTFAQQPQKVVLYYDSIGLQTPTVGMPLSVKDMAKLNASIQNAPIMIDSLHRLGYLEAYLIQDSQSDITITYLFHLGPQYTWKSIELSGLPTAMTSLSGKYNTFNNKLNWTMAQCRSAMSDVLRSYDRAGFPFAQAYLDSIRLVQGRLSGSLKLIPGPQVTIDTITWDDDIKVSGQLVLKAIQLEPGMKFSKQSLLSYEQGLAAYPFLESYALPLVTYYRDKASIRLYLKEKKLNHLDALLGFLPSSGQNMGLKINGTLNAYFLNQFRQGESIKVDFQSLQNNSQSLKLDVGVPSLLNLPFNSTGRFNLYKRDSLFLDVLAEVGAIWPAWDHGTLRINIGTSSSSLLKPNLYQIRTTHRLPTALDIRSNYIGSLLRWTSLDDPFNPRKGLVLQGYITGSSRKIIPNAAISSLKDPSDSSFSFQELYIPYKKNGYTIDWGFNAEGYLPLGKFSAGYNSLRAGFKTASSLLKQNELYRLGGYTLLRGFDEESIFARNYLIWINEWRLYTGDRSYWFVHSDLASLSRLQNEDYRQKIHWGLGGGLVFNTAVGLLSISTSVGRVFPDAFDLRAVKLHIGYINFF